MAHTNNEKKDHWNTQAYQSAAGFVPKLTTKVVSYLNPQLGEKILDIGCGDGPLTARIAQSCKEVLGVDSSKSFIQTAQDNYKDVPNCKFLLHDATKLESCEEVVEGRWDKVFSNAAMHWILRNPETRTGFFQNVNKALRTGGTFAFEMGGAGNVAEIHTACIAALTHAGISLEQAREASPWFFPSNTWMRTTLEEAGFEVEVCELEYRPSKLEEGALEGWVRLMCAEFLEKVENREEVLREILGFVGGIVRREEDGRDWLGYVRLRALAKKR